MSQTYSHPGFKNPFSSVPSFSEKKTLFRGLTLPTNFRSASQEEIDFYLSTLTQDKLTKNILGIGSKPDQIVDSRQKSVGVSRNVPRQCMYLYSVVLPNSNCSKVPIPAANQHVPANMNELLVQMQSDDDIGNTNTSKISIHILTTR
jgi:hypothetical protein